MVETRYIRSEELIVMWHAAAAHAMFPDELRAELRPNETLAALGDDIQATRERLRPQVDDLIERMLDADTHEDWWRWLQRTDRTLAALFLDRIQAATFSLETWCRDKEVVQIAKSWTTTVRLLMLQMSLQ